MTEPLTAETIAELEREDARIRKLRDKGHYFQTPSESVELVSLLAKQHEVFSIVLAAARRVAELPDVGEPELERSMLTWRSKNGRVSLCGGDIVQARFDGELSRSEALMVAAMILAAASRARSSEAEGGGR